MFASIQTLWRVSGQHFHALGITRVHRALDGTIRRRIYTAKDATGLLDAVIPHEMTHALVGNGAGGVAVRTHVGSAVVHSAPRAKVRVEPMMEGAMRHL